MKGLILVAILVISLCSCDYNEDRIAELESQLETTQNELEEAQGKLDNILSEIDDVESSIVNLRNEVNDFSYQDWRINVYDVDNATSDLEYEFSDLQSAAE